MKGIENYIKYNPIKGTLTWIKNKGTAKIGQICKNKSLNYIRIGFKGKDYLGHRIAWYLYYGYEPKEQIDHINGIKNDNRIKNLRLVTNRKNNQNKKIHRNGKLLGASYDRGKRKSQYKIKGKSVHIGYFKTEIEAHNAYMSKMKQLGE